MLSMLQARRSVDFVISSRSPARARTSGHSIMAERHCASHRTQPSYPVHQQNDVPSHTISGGAAPVKLMQLGTDGSPALAIEHHRHAASRADSQPGGPKRNLACREKQDGGRAGSGNHNSGYHKALQFRHHTSIMYSRTDSCNHPRGTPKATPLICGYAGAVRGCCLLWEPRDRGAFGGSLLTSNEATVDEISGVLVEDNQPR